MKTSLYKKNKQKRLISLHNKTKQFTYHFRKLSEYITRFRIDWTIVKKL